MSSPSEHQSVLNTSVSKKKSLTLIIHDATKTKGEASTSSDNNFGVGISSSLEHTESEFSQSRSQKEKDASFAGKSSAVRRHFAQFERRQLQEVNDDIELGWNCGICMETAEDPCVTRCGHLYCRSHLNNWLSTHPSCPVCKSLCTPAQDVIPIFARGQPSPMWSPISSSCSSPSLSPGPHSRSSSPERKSEYPVPHAHTKADVDPVQEEKDSSQFPSCPIVSSSPPPPHLPHRTFMTYIPVHYLGIALRVLGLALLLGVLLPGGFFSTSPASSLSIS